MLHLTRNGAVLEVRFEGRLDRNLLTWEVLRELRDFAVSHHAVPGLRVVVLAGQPTSFSGGFDLQTGVPPLLNAPSLEQLRELNDLGAQMCAAWERMQCFTIAAIEGHCVGGAAALALACDARVGSESARFYVPEILRGMNLQWGAIPRLVNLVGPGRAKQICIVARPLTAPLAWEWGVFESVVPAGGALSAALAMADDVARRPPVAVRMIKRAIDAYANALADLGAMADGDQFLLLTKGEDFAEGIESFLEHRPPSFTGR